MKNYNYDLIKVTHGNKYLASAIQYSKNNEISLIMEAYSEYMTSNPTYEISLANYAIVEYKTIRCKEYYIEERIEAVFKRWADLEIKQHKNDLIQSIEEKVRLLNSDMAEFESSITSILQATLDVNDVVNWDSLQDNRSFPTAKPKKPVYSTLVSYPDMPSEPTYKEYREKPNKDNYEYRPKFNFWDKLSSSSKERKIKEAADLLEKSLESWIQDASKVDATNAELKELYKQKKEKHKRKCSDVDRKIEEYKIQYKDKVDEWLNDKELFIQKQKEYNSSIDDQEKRYLDKHVDAILSYNTMVLDNSIYPDIIDKLFDIEYLKESGTIIIDYLLPDYNHIPTVKEYKYVKSRNDITERKRPEVELNRLYESICYQLAIRTLHEIIEADIANAVNEVVFNGYVSEINPATGHLMNHCILSVKSSKDNFLQINLEGIDPKISFKEALKGKSYAKLNSFSEVEPLLKSSRDWSFKRKQKNVESFSKEDILNIDIDEPDNESILNIAVKGLTYRSMEEKLIASTLKIGEPLLLESEPDNKFDKTAIKVLTQGNTHIGYVERDYSLLISTNLNNIIHCKVSKITPGRDNIPYIYADISIKDSTSY